ncbi:MAG: glutathione S-transferase, partial [Hyphomicrobiales bacterium]|nr:glutathione S-transferase [Hyphomicrobiales bacterium]
RKAHGKGGPFLFGKFGAVDAMYAPVVARFVGYAVELPKAARDYRDAVADLPAYRAWAADAAAEPWRIERFEAP